MMMKLFSSQRKSSVFLEVVANQIEQHVEDIQANNQQQHPETEGCDQIGDVNRDDIEVGVSWNPYQDWTHDERDIAEGCYQMGDLPTNDFRSGGEDEYHAHDDGGIDYNCVNNIDGPEEGVDNTGIGPSGLVHETSTHHGSNPFFGVPEPYRDIENEVSQIHLVAPRDGRFKITDQFASKQVLIDTICRDALENGYQFKVSSSNKKRWDIKCLHEGCKWKAGAGKLSNSDVFVLKKFGTHTCPRDIIRPHHRQAGKRAMGKILQSLFTAGDRAWRAKNWALNEIRGSPEESFKLLPIFCHNLEQRNPGTITQIDTDEDHRFHFVFMALGCSIRAFRDFCRPVICIDGAFLKGRYWGTLFIAVGKDGNNQIFPLAFDIGGKEETITWSPFLRALYRCIGDIPNLAIISDRHNAIIRCVREVFPNAHHGWCNHHIKGNMRSRYKQTKHIEGLFWRAAKAYRIEDFQEALRMIRAENPTATAYLEGIDYQRWARAYFPGIRYNIMTTNIAESFNALARQTRKLPVMMLLEFLRSTLQKWFYTRRNMAGACTHSLTPWAEEKMASHIQKSANMVVKPITIDRYEVHAPSKPVAIVDLAKKECTCRKFQLSQIACTHVAAIARFQKLSHCYPWVNKYYSAEYWRAVYRENVEPLGDPSEWVQ
ncbi:uncharacterized protein LOC123198030 [Mangifera indica]|uniref:uncharacterized protein LOC123198030 n=1 Tax=Mangifera indica TaxID=29780 RepID=UPI001CFC2163|nr:uncharacterized protein LOC123198030 [Mangifera indica]